MTEKEIRMRCIEALSSGGIREPARLTRDAEHLLEWVLAASDEGQADEAPRRAGRPPKADKGTPPA